MNTATATITGRPAQAATAAVLPTRQALVRSTYAVILAGGRGTRLAPLSERCAKPALPFAGHSRIIDFALSNCVNSGIRRIGVLTQYKAQRLIRHVIQGWSFLDRGLDERVDVVPAQQQHDEGWYSGTADAVFQNLDLVRESGAELVIVLAGDHVYRMDYGPMLAEHVRRRAHATVACIDVPLRDACAFGVVRTDADGVAIGFEEKPACPRPMPGRADAACVSMGVYVFDAAFLRRMLERDALDPTSRHDFGRDILPAAIACARVCAYDFGAGTRRYWRDVGTLDAYWDAHMDLLRGDAGFDPFDPAWPVHGAPQQLAPARVESGPGGIEASIADALLAAGCAVRGARVCRSVLYPGVRVGPGSVIEDAVLLPGAVVGADAIVRRAIVDEGAVLHDGARVGVASAEDRARYVVTGRGLVVVMAAMLQATAAPGAQATLRHPASEV
ncbi:MAG: glucose-1-phosphate adenylyltransferase [Proteobacteria bacterium]|nr:glucose-1-phosphate adenylyltransferase [Pseudomonadota bacterium]